MKTALIVLLVLALAGAALLTRPDRRELMLHVLDTQAGNSWSADDLRKAEDLARNAKFHNRILWTDVEKDGKVIYTGAFSHWVARGPGAEKPVPPASQLAELTKLVSR